jgi:flagellar secretion chaperone FliS
MSYLEGAVRGASPVRLVILLYGQAIEDLRRALCAHARADIEGRTREINHALLVIAHLQGTLNKDQGGAVAAHLERFYNQLRGGLVEAQCRQSGAALEQHISHLMMLRDAWGEVERVTEPTVQPSAPGQSGTGSDPARGRAPGNWKA